MEGSALELAQLLARDSVAPNAAVVRMNIENPIYITWFYRAVTRS